MIPKTKAAIEEAAKEMATIREGAAIDMDKFYTLVIGMQEVIEHPERYGLHKKITPVINTVPGCDFEDFHSKYSDTDE